MAQEQQQTSQQQQAVSYDIETPLNLIEQDHESVRGLFQRCRQADPETREDLANKLSDELIIHTKMEEEAFYPRLRHISEDLVARSIQEHDDVDQLLVKLVAIPATDAQFDQVINELQQHAEEHMQMEESEVFPLVREEMADEAESLTLNMQSVRDSVNPSEVRNQLIQRFRGH